MKTIGIVFMALVVLILAFLLYKLVGPWVFAIIVIVGLLSRFKK